MDILGFWKVTDVNVMDKDFKKTWRKAEDVLADSNITPVQKGMAQTCYVFEAGGVLKQLFPKELDPSGIAPAYDDKYIIGHETRWKEENGKLCFATEENGDDQWNEVVQDGDSIILFGMQKLVKV